MKFLNMKTAFDSLRRVSCNPMMDIFSVIRSSSISSNLQISLMPRTLSEVNEIVFEVSFKRGEFCLGENLLVLLIL